MAILDWLTGADQVEQQRELADEAAREQFDPGIFAPALEQARQQATEGINDEQIRQQIVEQIFGRTDTSQVADIAGGNQSRALAFAERMNQARQESLAQAETQIGIQEAEAQERGEQAFAQVRTQQEQTTAQREATIAENRAKAEAEKERRRGALGSALGSVVGTVAGSALGPAGAAIGGGLGGALFGGGEGAATGATSGISTALQQQEEEQFSQMIDRFLAGTNSPEEPTTPIQQPQDEIIPANIDTSLPNQEGLSPEQQGQFDFMDRIMRGQLGIF